MKELVVIKKVIIGTEEINSVDARELHSFLEVGTRFDTWFDRRVKEYEFIMNTDFCSILSESSGGRPSTDYYITLDMAKELAMVENNEKGKEARKYFIDCEKKLKEITTNLSPMEVIVQMAQKCLDQEREMKAIQSKQDIHSQKLLEIESKVKTSGSDYYSVSGYANLKGYKQIDIHKANLIGRTAAKLSSDYGEHIGKTKDERFGQVNIYHIDMLVEAFRKHGYY